MKDLSGLDIQVGDKVATQVGKLLRIGEVVGFTDKKVKVGLAYSSDPNIITDVVNIYPYRLAILKNQGCGLQDYFKYR